MQTHTEHTINSGILEICSYSLKPSWTEPKHRHHHHVDKHIWTKQAEKPEAK